MIKSVIGMFDDRSKHCCFEQLLQQKEEYKKNMKYR